MNQARQELLDDLTAIVQSTLEDEVDAEIKSGERRTHEDLARAVTEELSATLFSPQHLVKFLDVVRMTHFCAYASPGFCDCKYMPPRIAFLLDDPPPKLNSEQTGCPEIRDAIRALEAGDWTGWQKLITTPRTKDTS